MRKVNGMAFAVLVAAATPSAVQASCGTAYCTVNTDWNVQGVYAEPGARVELRYEYLDQNQLRSGSSRTSASDDPQHHDEVYTRNQGLYATFDYNFASGWGVSAVVPVLDRKHEHIHNHHGAQIPEQWDYTELGDIRVVGRYQFPLATQDTARAELTGFLFGLKLPTGSTNVKNAEGDKAERSLQPGTGTTDAILGAYYQVRLPFDGLAFFVQGGFGAALNSDHHYRPGNRVTADFGMSYAATENVSLLLQLNTLWRGRDSGSEAEPDDSGGTFVFISPGVSIGIGRNFQLFGLVQVPIYQYVNGVQLTADWGGTAGIGYRF